LGIAFGYALLQKVFHVIAETPAYITKQTSKYLQSAKVSGEITPEYMGVGYIIGPKIAGVLVAGGVFAWLVMIPLLSKLVPPDVIVAQLVKLGYLKDVLTSGGKGGWNPATHAFDDYSAAIYYAYVRQIGAGAVAAGGFITLIKTIPTIISSFKGSVGAISKNEDGSKVTVLRTERDLDIKVVLFGSLGLIVLMAFLPQLPGDGIGQKLLIGLLVVIFGAFFVTVSSRIVGLIGSSNNPISGMTIATLMGTCLIFIAVGWTGKAYEPMALVVGGMICIAAANAGGTSQDLKSGYIVGATPRNQQIALFIGAIVSSIVIGLTVNFLDKPTAAMIAKGVTTHAIGSEFYPAPQGTLMATLDKGILSNNLDWQFVLAGVFVAIVMELCNIKALSFAVGAYLPLSTTLPIFVGGAIKGLAEMYKKKKNIQVSADEEELGKGSLFATGLVAGGAVAGVIFAIMAGFDGPAALLAKLNMEAGVSGVIGHGAYQILGVLFFAAMGWILYRTALKK
jgi:putative OPT family oligopeptide transporter